MIEEFNRSFHLRAFLIERDCVYFRPQVETDMTEDEVKKFEEDWTNLWDPDHDI